MTTEAERISRLEGAYEHLATKADLYRVESSLTIRFAGLLLTSILLNAGIVFTLMKLLDK